MAQVTDAEKITALEKKVAEQEKTIQKQDGDLKDAEKVVADLKEKLAEKESGTVKLPTVKLDKDTYELHSGPFTWAGKEVTIDTLKEDSKLVAELVKNGVANLRKVVATA